MYVDEGIPKNVFLCHLLEPRPNLRDRRTVEYSPLHDEYARIEPVLRPERLPLYFPNLLKDMYHLINLQILFFFAQKQSAHKT